MLLKNGRIRVGTKLEKKDILIEGNKIIKISDHIEGDGIDLENKYVCPGLTDIHVHFREPGFEYKETIKTGSMSAAKGGYTTVLLMPNLKPCPDSVNNLLVEEEIIKKDSVIECLPYCSVTKNEEGKELSDIIELKEHTKYFSDDGVGINNIDILKKGLEIIRDNDLFIASHAEDKDYKTDPKGEYLAVRREIEIAKELNARYHFCHMSTKESFKAIKDAQKAGYKITCEVSPHHLFLNENMIKDTNWKMNPPLRSEKDRLETVNALLNNVATVIATDHAPHSKSDKDKEYSSAANGIIGLETCAPLVYTNLIKNGLATFKDFEDWLSNNPRKLIGLKENRIKEGEVANLCVLDIDNIHTYKETEIESKGHNCPYIGMSLYGFNTLTIYNGKIVFRK